jgi:hypothetical protein
MRLCEISYKPKNVKLSDSEDSIAAIRKYIETNCKPWIRESGGKFVYRGINELYAHKPVFTRNIRQNRRPTDSSLELHNLFNTIIGIAGGIANRTNSMFVFGSSFQTENYGHPFYVFPIGEFHYTWSPVWHDWYTARDDIKAGFAGIRDTTVLDKKLKAKIKKHIIVDRGLPKAIAGGREIMINCKQALYVNKSDYYLGTSL